MPELREAILGVADVPFSIEEGKNLFKGKLDTSRVAREDWYLEGLTQAAKIEIAERQESKSLTDAVVDTVISRVSKKLDAIEMPEQLMERSSAAKRVIREMQVKYGGRVAVVSHSILIQALTEPPNGPLPSYNPKSTWIRFTNDAIYPKNGQCLAIDKCVGLEARKVPLRRSESFKEKNAPSKLHFTIQKLPPKQASEQTRVFQNKRNTLRNSFSVNARTSKAIWVEPGNAPGNK